MSKKIPTKEHSLFIICEDVRSETNGKLSFMGVYPADRIIVNQRPGLPAPTDSVAILEQLTIVVILRDGSGRFNARAEILGPENLALIDLKDLGDVQLGDGAIATLAIKGYNVKIAGFGRYTVRILLDDAALIFPFDIVQGTATSGKNPSGNERVHTPPPM